MCGITGFVSFVNNIPGKEAIIQDMCSIMLHRGPDGQGMYCDDTVAIGMRRLAIIDVEGGRQPIHNETNDIWLVFNGEIYNYLELREQLLRQGHSFYTESDSEVIVHLYEQHGESFVDFLRGMFGIAIWDHKARKFLLIRDRLGIKPMYFSIANNTLVFGSEIKCLLRYPDFPASVNAEFIDEYFSLGYVLAPNTLFTGVKKLKPGEMIIATPSKMTKKSYWELSIGESLYTSMEETLEIFKEKLTESIRLRLRSDVPFGAFLSGGIDSSLVVAYMAKLMDQPVKTFSIGFENAKYDELAYARAVAERFGTDHHEFIVKPDAVEVVEKVVWHCDEPFGDSSAIPTYYVCKMAREHVTMTLSGDGGDELFWGYERYIKFLKLQQLARVPRRVRNCIFTLAGKLLKNSAKKNKNEWYKNRLDADPFPMYMMGVGLLQDFLKTALYSKEMRARATTQYDFPSLRRFQFTREEYSFEKLPFLDMHTYLVEDILKKVDRMSMANSLEARVPYLDHEFVSFALKVDNRLKIRGYEGKFLMRKALEEFMPADFINRPKMGFALPINEWLRDDLKEIVADTLLDRTFRDRGYFDDTFVARLINEHNAKSHDHSEVLWLLLNFELWHRQYID